MSKSLSKEQIETVFAKFDSNKVLKLLHISISLILEIMKHKSMKDGKLSKEEFKNLMENRK